MGARALARAAHAKPHLAVKIKKSSNFGLEGRIFYQRARKCARAKIFFWIVKCMKFTTFYVFEIFLYLLNWLLWMAMKCLFFFNFSKKIWFFLENFQNLKIFKKIEFSRKNFKLQIALKNLLFELWPNKKICNEILS